MSGMEGLYDDSRGSGGDDGNHSVKVRHSATGALSIVTPMPPGPLMSSCSRRGRRTEEVEWSWVQSCLRATVPQLPPPLVSDMTHREDNVLVRFADLRSQERPEGQAGPFGGGWFRSVLREGGRE